MGPISRYWGGASDVIAHARSPSVGAYAPWAAPRARRFFEVPNLSDLCEKTFSSSKTVQHSPEDLFAVVADVDRYREFVPFCAGSRVLRRTSHSRFEAELADFESRQYDIRQRIVETENRINFLVGRFPQPVERNSGSFMETEPAVVRSPPLGASMPNG
ncbi:SRPBCC family protein [uncultured Salinisphaera sp.]|uniref:SRPBCC family protein n=1 Tax=uncultured Salinisphaera sp. TaxID=359372 RepID=UPI0032B10412